MGLFVFLLSFFPRFNFESQIYNIQTVIAWVSGVILGPRLGAIVLGFYLLLGFIGLPVFAGGGGFDYYKEPTFGYLISLPLNAYISGLLYEKNKKILAVFIPMLATHLCGILYLLFFKQSWLSVSWHLSFSMIGYDLIFALLLMPLMPIFSFVLKEMITQEIPVRDASLFTSRLEREARYKKYYDREKRDDL
ncbi:MAG: biotin transporter BioY [Candidatus Melainabacteria bacterium]|nr:biotin transporter BioY [Candidatus Melainabacteria bacterium]